MNTIPSEGANRLATHPATHLADHRAGAGLASTAADPAPHRPRHALVWLVDSLWLLGGAVLVAMLALGAAPSLAATDPGVLYHNYCSVCHGDKGDGRSRATGALSTPPRDFTSADSRRELTVARIATAITHGRPGTAMVGWQTQLSPGDIARLAEHVHTRYVMGQAGSDAPSAISGTKAHGGREADGANPANPAAPPVHTPARVDMTAGLPNGLKGDLKRGGAFYMANCATCHGARGDGAGPRAYFINPKPRNFLEDATRARFNRVALYAAISEGSLGSEMPAWSKVATPQQMADVAEYVFRQYLQPGPQAKGQAQAAAPAR